MGAQIPPIARTEKKALDGVGSAKRYIPTANLSGVAGVVQTRQGTGGVFSSEKERAVRTKRCTPGRNGGVMETQPKVHAAVAFQHDKNKHRVLSGPGPPGRDGAGAARRRAKQLSHIIHPLLLAVKRHVRDDVDRGDVPRYDADSLSALPDPLAHLLVNASVPWPCDNSGTPGVRQGGATHMGSASTLQQQ